MVTGASPRWTSPVFYGGRCRRRSRLVQISILGLQPSLAQFVHNKSHRINTHQSQVLLGGFYEQFWGHWEILGTEHSARKNLIVNPPELKILGGAEIIASLSYLAVTQLRKGWFDEIFELSNIWLRCNLSQYPLSISIAIAIFRKRIIWCNIPCYIWWYNIWRIIWC